MIYEKLMELGVETQGIVSEPDRPTTRKTRVIASNQQVLRIDKEIKTQITDSTLEKLMVIIGKKMGDVDVVIISDYDKGLVTKQLVEKTLALAQDHNLLTLADPKALSFLKYAGVSVITPNKKEAALAANMEISTQEDLSEAGKKLMDQIGRAHV